MKKIVLKIVLLIPCLCLLFATLTYAVKTKEPQVDKKEVYMTISNWLILPAVLLAPFIAIFAQSKIDLLREKRNHKLWVFRTLMATRGNKISLEHVQALNSIELVFKNAKKEKQIVEKWNEYLDHLVQKIDEEGKDYSVRLKAWADGADDLLADLLYIMSKSLGYTFDKVKIKRGIYVPRAHGEDRLGSDIIRRGLVDIMSRKKGFPVEILQSTTEKGKTK